ncbi:helix-turn-helix transcriptional regulator [Luteibacter sp. RCC_6_2]|uniref:helix-turn-helix transcriptional regulator n=1 Tax=Luteibacter sp. RCC_6_2 TaxID=3239223 RepID=UPI003526243A
MTHQAPPSLVQFDRPVTFPALKRDYGIPFSRWHILDLERRGEFPRRFMLSSRTCAWLHGELVEYLNKRIASRNTPPAEVRE